MPRTSPPVINRLRASTRLAVLVLFVFFIKIGAAAACAKHDFGDLGFDSGQTSSVISQAVPVDAGGDQSPVLLGHVSMCGHCGCQHASALPSSVPQFSSALVFQRHSHRVEAPPSAALRLELRPRIV